MLKPTAMFFWRKLDHPGHDSCRLFKLANGWRLAGAAVFWDDGQPWSFSLRSLRRRGMANAKRRCIRFPWQEGCRPTHQSDRPWALRWQVNGVSKKSVRGCVDVDLGFTPATNMIALRRLSLKVGQRAEAPAAYLQFPEMRLVMLPQTYLRIGRTEYE